MKTISSYPLFGYQLQAGKLIASTSQSTVNSSLFMQNSVPYYTTNPLLLLMVIIGVGGVLASILSSAIKVVNEWEKLVVLRLGKFLALKGPGLVFIIPIIDTIPYRIDTRVITSSFQAEKTLTKDTVPVDVDAVLFWKVVDPQKAALDVADYKSAISWASQTALRDVIGKTMLSDMLEGREKISKDLQKIIDERTQSWGINVISVEVKDVLIPSALEDAMSMQAQAERERQARVILGDSERQVAEKFGEAAKTYINNPVALHLRAMNMLYEGLKDNATIVIVPSTAVESMQLGGLAGMTALTMGLGQEKSEIRKQEGIQSMRDVVEPNGTKLIANP
ncbi:slipin family protein [Nostoc sp.]|uniref:slipin family protein n=2 Tax=Nostoc sp. TaxID=1180 RepID=UPI002FF5F051